MTEEFMLLNVDDKAIANATNLNHTMPVHSG